MAGDLRGDDYIDSRDVIERMEELESELTDAHDDEYDEWVNSDRVPDDEGDEVPQSFDGWLKWVHDTGPGHLYWDEVDEYLALKGLTDEARDYSADWVHGEQLIRADKFAEYAEELASDIGAIDRNARWPLNHIDWEAAAEELKIDYTSVDFDGTEYLMRCS